MGKLPPGVEAHGANLRITFTVDGQRHKRSLGIPPTPTNIRAAGKLRARIKAAATAGLFRWADYFPQDARATGHLFQPIAKQWLAHQQRELATSTHVDYRRSLANIWLPAFGEHPVASITTGAIRNVLGAQTFGAKRQNNVMIPLRKVLAYAMDELGLIPSNPALAIKHIKVQKQPPDPFSLAEANTLTTWLSQHEAPGSHNLYDFAFFSGLRVSELLALTWPQVDLHSGYVRIDRAQVMRQTKSTKTVTVRDVRLNQRATAALQRQKAISYLAGGNVFLDPITGQPYVNDRPPRLVFERALKATGIRPRPPKNTRHTYATAGLMAGYNPALMAKQMGHSVTVFFTIYARWIEGAATDREMEKLEAFIAQNAP